MRHNPEWQRQIWLHWRPSLLGWSAALVSLLLAVAWVSSAPGQELQNIGLTALLGLWAASAGYASLLAGRSLSDELHQNTWDWQRLSALSPWQIAWGKLLGATLPAWLYAAWFGLVLLLVSTLWSTLWQHSRGFYMLALAVLWGLAVQAWAMNWVLLGWAAGRSWLTAFLLLLLGPMLGGLVLPLLGSHNEQWQWWGWTLEMQAMASISGLLALALGLLSLWRQLCERLDVNTLPWAWPLGVLALAGFATGFAQAPTLALLLQTLAGVALLASGYIALQQLPLHARAWRQVQAQLQRRRWRAALYALPLWPVSWLLALLAALLSWAQPASRGTPTGHWIWLLLALLLLRDCLLLTGIALQGRRWNSPLAVVLLSLLVIHLLLPLLALGLLGQPAAIALQPLALLWNTSAQHWSSDSLGSTSLAWAALAGQLILTALWVRTVFRRQYPA